MIPNSEKAALDYLRAELGVPVYVVPPKAAALPYVRVHRVGGDMRNIVTDAPLLIIGCYAGDPSDAAELANRAREAMFNARGTWVGRTWVRWWEEVGGPAFFPDPDIDATRYQFTGILTVATNTV